MAGAAGKKLLNSVDKCVDDNLDGYVAMNPGVRLLKGYRVVVRADFEELQKAGKVSVVSGGGSGHEPAFTGKHLISAIKMTLHNRIYNAPCLECARKVHPLNLSPNFKCVPPTPSPSTSLAHLVVVVDPWREKLPLSFFDKLVTLWNAVAFVCPAACRHTGWSLFVGCLTSQQHASVSQGRICTDNFTCCHTEIEVADQTFYLTQSQYTDTGPISPSADPITPGAWQGSPWSANFWVTGMTRPRKNPGASGIRTRDLPLSRRTPYH